MAIVECWEYGKWLSFFRRKGEYMNFLKNKGGKRIVFFSYGVVFWGVFVCERLGKS